MKSAHFLRQNVSKTTDLLQKNQFNIHYCMLYLNTHIPVILFVANYFSNGFEYQSVPCFKLLDYVYCLYFHILTFTKRYIHISLIML